MKDFFYFGSIRKSIIQFLNIFDDLKIAKYDKQGNINKYVDVPIKFMPKSKFYSWVNERTHEKRYPCIGVEIVGIEYDNQRHTGKHEKVHLSVTDDSVTYQQSPIPYNITFDMHIATEYISEMDQLVEQILPFFDPFVFTRVKVDELGFAWDMNVRFDSCNIDEESDIDDYRKVEWVLSFTTQTFMLKPTSNINTIRKVVNKFYLSEESWNNIDTTTDMPSGQGSEDEEILVIGSKEDNKILIEYERYD